MYIIFFGNNCNDSHKKLPSHQIVLTSAVAVKMLDFQVCCPFNENVIVLSVLTSRKHCILICKRGGGGHGHAESADSKNAMRNLGLQISYKHALVAVSKPQVDLSMQVLLL